MHSPFLARDLTKTLKGFFLNQVKLRYTIVTLPAYTVIIFPEYQVIASYCLNGH